MLDTLIRIGKHLSEDRGEWDDIIDVPDTTEVQTKGITPLVAQLLFDLDENQIILDRTQLKVFEPQDAYTFMCIKIQGGNNKAIYATVSPKKSFEQIRKTFFGITDKNGKVPDQGQFTEAIDKDFQFLKTSPFYRVLQETFALAEDFTVNFVDQEKNKADFGKVTKALELSGNERIVLLYAAVKSQEFGIPLPTSIANVSGYEDFLRAKFLKEDKPNKAGSPVEKLCYATGAPTADVEEITIGARYSMNKMFVTTTKNYASNFNEKAFGNNYQASALAQLYLERGSNYLLNNYTTKIAGVDHIIIPHFFSREDVEPDILIQRVAKRTDLLFRYKQLAEMVDDFSDNELYWLNFLGYESDGNFFKTINTIQDVSKLHFNKLIEVFITTDRAFKSIIGIEWDKIMTVGKDNRLSFNFYSLYALIPVRKDKEKKNAALALFKAILEQRKTDPQQLYKHFTELILCHWYGRYKAYGNVYQNDIFDFAARNAVYQYHALFYILNQLNLLKGMENTKTDELTDQLKPSDAFLKKMNYNDSQKAMFYLGKILNSVAYAQQKKGYDSKPVLNKVNYNGMDKKAIVRLHKDLFDKCRQYAILSYNELLFSQFTQLFNSEKWPLKSEEALFYLLAGYSFRDNA
ncbi:TM1802 family CRISPR-associated protein [Litoribacter populi]|uniref:TM1802 family CRISPR-associated protein n=1 Tax=Litoribacter populi TaxID=2598460 RepID=UPI00117C2203|nr:TM1802 family CRISPR-associated protein [Litoribacter populi]